jgi:predicted DNA-binding protein
MIRSQIYLTKVEKTQLHKLSRQMGKSQSELIREAIDHFIELNLKQSDHKLLSIQAAKGMWLDRDNLPNFANIRKEFDRDNEK